MMQLHAKVSFTGENTIVIVSGANQLLNVTDVENSEVLIRNASVVVCQLEVPAETSLAALKLGRKHGGMQI